MAAFFPGYLTLTDGNAAPAAVIDQGLGDIPGDGAGCRHFGDFIQCGTQVIGCGPVRAVGNEGVEYVADRNDLNDAIFEFLAAGITGSITAFMMIAGGDGCRMPWVLEKVAQQNRMLRQVASDYYGKIVR